MIVCWTKRAGASRVALQAVNSVMFVFGERVVL